MRSRRVVHGSGAAVSTDAATPTAPVREVQSLSSAETNLRAVPATRQRRDALENPFVTLARSAARPGRTNRRSGPYDRAIREPVWLGAPSSASCSGGADSMTKLLLPPRGSRAIWSRASCLLGLAMIQCACASRPTHSGPSEAYITQIHAATQAFNSGAFQAAAAAIQKADAAAVADSDRARVEDLRRLLRGTRAFAGGDFENARDAWMSVQDPALYEQIRRHAHDLALELPPR